MIDVENQNIKENFIEVSKKYEALGSNVVQALKIFLDREGISYLTVYYRVKDINSFIEKIDRKNYVNPFEQSEDICGIRIICYYRSDVEKICNIINREFQVMESEDKEDSLEPDQFGYRSHHFIVKIKDEWLCTPNYIGLNNLKAEIQVRTNLMHTWAEIEHKLEYKKEQDIPKLFKRRFSLLSAMLEIVDEQFETLKKDITGFREEYKEKIKESENNIIGINEDDIEVNLDTLQAFLDLYFSDRKKDTTISKLVAELNHIGMNISTLKETYNKYKATLDEMEKELFEGREEKWTQTGIIRYMLMLTNDQYFNDKPIVYKHTKNFISKYKSKLAE